MSWEYISVISASVFLMVSSSISLINPSKPLMPMDLIITFSLCKVLFAPSQSLAGTLICHSPNA